MKYKILLLSLFLIITAQAQTGTGFSMQKLIQTEQPSEENIQSGSKGVNILLSLLLPGAGEWRMGRKNTAKFFFGTEFMLWAGYFSFNAYADVIKNDYQAFASVHAGVNPNQKNDQYWIEIGSAENIYLYNEQRLRERDIPGTYPETDLYYWQWDSKDSRRRYNQLRVNEHDWERRATFVVSGFILNRLISAVDVLRLIRKEKRAEEQRMSRLYFDYKKDRLGSDVFRLNLALRW
jgi:hypothetical protein